MSFWGVLSSVDGSKPAPRYGNRFLQISMQSKSNWTIIGQTEIDTFKTYLNNLKPHFVFKTKNMHRKHDLAVSRCMPLSQGSHGNQNLQFSMLNTQRWLNKAFKHIQSQFSLESVLYAKLVTLNCQFQTHSHASNFSRVQWPTPKPWSKRNAASKSRPSSCVKRPWTLVKNTKRTQTSILVGGWATPLKNMKVSWDYKIPNIWKNKAMFQTTNQYLFTCPMDPITFLGSIWSII